MPCSERVNSLAPTGCGSSFEIIIFQLIIINLVNRCEPQNLIDDKSVLVQVMAWCRQATSHYLNQCRPRYMSPYGVTRPQWLISSVHICCIANTQRAVSNSHSQNAAIKPSLRTLGHPGFRQWLVTMLLLRHYPNQYWLIIFSQDPKEQCLMKIFPTPSMSNVKGDLLNT